MFKTAVHKNASISKIDKFNYLNSLLEGAAARTLLGMQLTECNYDDAIEILQARFGDPQQIIAGHVDELYKLPDCTTDKSSSLRNVYDKLNTHIRGLNSLGMDLKEFGGLLIPVVMSKIPEDVHLRITRENHGQVWKMDILRWRQFVLRWKLVKPVKPQEWLCVRYQLSLNNWSGKGNQPLVL